MVVACGKMLEKYSLKIDEFLPRNRHCQKRILRVSNFEKSMAEKKPDVLLQYWDFAARRCGGTGRVRGTDWIVGDPRERSEKVVELSRHDAVIVST
jgi:hypothetical protein